jgi:chemotaxis protein MotB
LRDRRRTRKHPYEDHANHEAWAIPYGDLITLLLAFFVVMYAMSSVNEGKYRVLSSSLVAAFNGKPKTMDHAQVGEQKVGSGVQGKAQVRPDGALDAATLRAQAQARELDRVAKDLEGAMGNLIQASLVSIHRTGTSVEVQIRTDILFASGQAQLAPRATPVLNQIAATLNRFPNPLRVEGHTDNVPIRTNAFRSNWELSAARAASVVHLLADHGVKPARLSVIGLAEFHPIADNHTDDGRNANRRVVIAIQGSDGDTSTTP